MATLAHKGFDRIYIYIFRHVFSTSFHTHLFIPFHTSQHLIWLQRLAIAINLTVCLMWPWCQNVPKGRCSKADTRGAVAAAAGVLPLAALTAVTAALAADSSSAEAHRGRCQRCRRCWSPEGQTQPLEFAWLGLQKHGCLHSLNTE